MSRIHQALTRPLPAARPATGFNPLNAKPRATGGYWWLVAIAALALAVLLLWSPWRAQPEAPAEPQRLAAVPAVPDSLTALVPELQASLQRLQAEPSDALALLASRQGAASVKPGATQAVTDSATATDSASATDLVPRTPIPAPPSAAEALPKAAQPAPTASAQPEPRERIGASVVRVEQPWQDQVQAALADNNLNAAEQTLRAWIDNQPTAAQPRIWLAKLWLSQGRLDAIDSLLEQQHSIEARGLLALWHEKAGRPEQAAALFEQLSRIQPDHGAWLLHWAINSENSAQLAQAVLLYHTYLNRFAADNPSLTAFADNRVRSLETP